MFEPVPASVETAIYLYFLGVATVGLSVHWRLWRTARVDSGPTADGE